LKRSGCLKKGLDVLLKKAGRFTEKVWTFYSKRPDLFHLPLERRLSEENIMPLLALHSVKMPPHSSIDLKIYGFDISFFKW
jgi:hypothetical protein